MADEEVEKRVTLIAFKVTETEEALFDRLLEKWKVDGHAITTESNAARMCWLVGLKALEKTTGVFVLGAEAGRQS